VQPGATAAARPAPARGPCAPISDRSRLDTESELPHRAAKSPPQPSASIRQKLQRPLALIGTLPAVIVLTLLALAELVADKLSQTPSRTAPVGLIARLVTGGLAGACVSAGGAGSALLGALLGDVGGLVSGFAGYQARTRLVKASGSPDVVIALLEDLTRLCSV